MEKARVLFLAADPVSDPTQPSYQGNVRLRIDEEIKQIHAMIRASDHRDSLELVSRWAVTPDDLLQALNEVRPSIVHFSGHGSAEGEIILTGKDGRPQPVGKAALRALFATLKDNIRVVVLNACYSEAQVEGIVEVIDCAVGMNTLVSDAAGIIFAASFYRALGFGRSVQEAFDQAKVALMLHEITEEDTPRLRSREGVDPARILVVDPTAGRSAAPPDDPGRRSVHAHLGGVAIEGGVSHSKIHVENRFGEMPEERARAGVAVIRDEIQGNLERLASQISHTRINVPDGNPIPRRPGETRERFEDRDREWFAREVEYVFSLYDQFGLEDAVRAAHRRELPMVGEPKARHIDLAYRAAEEARNRLALYRTALQRLAASDDVHSDHRAEWARFHARQAASELAAEWFAMLGSWLMLEPEPAAVAAMGERIPQVRGDGAPAPALSAGTEGWRYAQRELGRLQDDKLAFLHDRMRLPFPPRPVERATTFVDAMQRAGLAYMEGRAEDAERFLEEATEFPDVPEEHRHYAKTSLDYLRDPDAFDGLLGTYLADVADGAAAEAGLRRGDVILRYNGSAVTEPNVLSRLIAHAHGAPHVAIEVARDGARLTRYVKGGVALGARGMTLVVADSFVV